mgnify:CR=1 FL=1
MKPTNRHSDRVSTTLAMQMTDVDHYHALVHSEAVVSEDAIVGAAAEWRGRTTEHRAIVSAGAVIREYATVHAGVERPTIIGPRTLLMTKAHVGHDTQIGADCDIAPNASIGGCVTIGDRVKIGMNACVRPHVTIGDGARIGMGAAVVCDIPAGETWAGVPARRIR